MNQKLAQEYGTPGASSEEIAKHAELELFAKLATQNGIDLNQLSDEQVAQLYNDTFGKTAQEEGDKEEEKKEEEKEEEKKEEGSAPPPFAKKEEAEKEAAAREFQAAQEWKNDQEKADFLGRKMAHAMVAELTAIGEAQSKTASQSSNDPATKLAAALERVSAKPKIASAQPGKSLDNLAVQQSVKLAAATGLDAEEVATRVAAVQTLGLLNGQESKTAAATNVDQAIEIRALEFLEAAGYPVTWE